MSSTNLAAGYREKKTSDAKDADEKIRSLVLCALRFGSTTEAEHASGGIDESQVTRSEVPTILPPTIRFAAYIPLLEIWIIPILKPS